MELEDLLNIDTPENVVFGYEIAGIGSRFLAALIDTILIVILQIIVNVLIVVIVDLEGSWAPAILGFVAFLILWGYYIYFELRWSGSSPGKQQVGLRVIRVDGTPISLSESLIRNLIRLIDFLPISYGVGVVTMFISSQSRRLGDLAAGTIVVWEQEKVTLDSLANSALPIGVRNDLETAKLAIDLPIEKLTVADIEMAENFLRRRGELPNRYDLAIQISQSLHRRMGVEVSVLIPAANTEQRILEIVKAYRAAYSK